MPRSTIYEEPVSPKTVVPQPTWVDAFNHMAYGLTLAKQAESKFNSILKQRKGWYYPCLEPQDGGVYNERYTPLDMDIEAQKCLEGIEAIPMFDRAFDELDTAWRIKWNLDPGDNIAECKTENAQFKKTFKAHLKEIYDIYWKLPPTRLGATMDNNDWLSKMQERKHLCLIMGCQKGGEIWNAKINALEFRMNPTGFQPIGPHPRPNQDLVVDFRLFPSTPHANKTPSRKRSIEADDDSDKPPKRRVVERPQTPINPLGRAAQVALKRRLNIRPAAKCHADVQVPKTPFKGWGDVPKMKSPRRGAISEATRKPSEKNKILAAVAPAVAPADDVPMQSIETADNYGKTKQTQGRRLEYAKNHGYQLRGGNSNTNDVSQQQGNRKDSSQLDLPQVNKNGKTARLIKAARKPLTTAKNIDPNPSNNVAIVMPLPESPLSGDSDLEMKENTEAPETVKNKEGTTNPSSFIGSLAIPLPSTPDLQVSEPESICKQRKKYKKELRVLATPPSGPVPLVGISSVGATPASRPKTPNELVKTILIQEWEQKNQDKDHVWKEERQEKRKIEKKKKKKKKKEEEEEEEEEEEGKEKKSSSSSKSSKNSGLNPTQKSGENDDNATTTSEVTDSKKLSKAELKEISIKELRENRRRYNAEQDARRQKFKSRQGSDVCMTNAPKLRKDSDTPMLDIRNAEYLDALEQQAQQERLAAHYYAQLAAFQAAADQAAANAAAAADSFNAAVYHQERMEAIAQQHTMRQVAMQAEAQAAAEAAAAARAEAAIAGATAAVAARPDVEMIDILHEERKRAEHIAILPPAQPLDGWNAVFVARQEAEEVREAAQQLALQAEQHAVSAWQMGFQAAMEKVRRMKEELLKRVIYYGGFSETGFPDSMGLPRPIKKRKPEPIAVKGQATEQADDATWVKALAEEELERAAGVVKGSLKSSPMPTTPHTPSFGGFSHAYDVVSPRKTQPAGSGPSTTDSEMARAVQAELYRETAEWLEAMSAAQTPERKWKSPMQEVFGDEVGFADYEGGGDASEVARALDQKLSRRKSMASNATEDLPEFKEAPKASLQSRKRSYADSAWSNTAFILPETQEAIRASLRSRRQSVVSTATENLPECQEAVFTSTRAIARPRSRATSCSSSHVSPTTTTTRQTFAGSFPDLDLAIARSLQKPETVQVTNNAAFAQRIQDKRNAEADTKSKKSSTSDFAGLEEAIACSLDGSFNIPYKSADPTAADAAYAARLAEKYAMNPNGPSPSLSEDSSFQFPGLKAAINAFKRSQEKAFDEPPPAYHDVFDFPNTTSIVFSDQVAHDAELAAKIEREWTEKDGVNRAPSPTDTEDLPDYKQALEDSLWETQPSLAAAYANVDLSTLDPTWAEAFRAASEEENAEEEEEEEEEEVYAPRRPSLASRNPSLYGGCTALGIIMERDLYGNPMGSATTSKSATSSHKSDKQLESESIVFSPMASPVTFIGKHDWMRNDYKFPTVEEMAEDMKGEREAEEEAARVAKAEENIKMRAMLEELETKWDPKIAADVTFKHAPGCLIVGEDKRYWERLAKQKPYKEDEKDWNGVWMI